MALSGWNHAQKIACTISAADVPSDQIDVPVLLNLTADAGLTGFDCSDVFAKLADNSLKIAVENGNTGNQCPVEIEAWTNGSGTAQLWVKIPALLAGSGGLLHFYYDETQADNVTNVGAVGSSAGQSVWTNNYKHVYHLSQAPGGAGTVLDSAGTGAINGTSVNMDSSDLVAADVGSGLEFNGADEQVSFAFPANLTTATVEISIKATTGTPAPYDGIFSADSNIGSVAMAFIVRGAGGGVSFYRNNSGESSSLAVTDFTAWNHFSYHISPTTEKITNHTSNTSASASDSISRYIHVNSSLARWYNESRRFPGIMRGLFISSVVRTDDWLAISHKSRTDTLITYSLPISSVVLHTACEQPYALPMDQFEVDLDQPYVIAVPLEVDCLQLYSILLEIWLTQHYGDMPWLEASLYQPYGGAAVLQRDLLQRWGSALEINIDLEQEWSLAETLQVHNVQGYGIAAEVLHLTSEQLYQINELTQLFTGLSQPYAIAGEAARLYSLTTQLFIDDERFPYHQLEWQTVITEYAWYCAFSTKSLAAARRCVDGAAIRIEHMGETWLLKCYGGWLLDRRHAEDVYRIEGWSRTRDLDLATPLLGDIPGGMASQIARDLAAPFGIAVDWQMADGYIAAGKLAANNQTPLAMIAEIVHDAEGIIQSTPDGNLLIVAAEETAVPDYPAVTPAVTINARLERISTSEQKDEQKGYNRFVVSDQVAGGDRFNLEYEPIDAGAREIRLFIVPIAGRQFVLTHSSGAEVGIEPFGLASLNIPDELVEFKAGVGQTAKPLYGISAMAWQKANLGAITFSEDGVLTAAVAGYSLLKISYVSRYHKWIGRSPNIEDIQFIAHEVTP